MAFIDAGDVKAVFGRPESLRIPAAAFFDSAVLLAKEAGGDGSILVA